MRFRRRSSFDASALIDAVREIGDALRTGVSLRESLVRAARIEGSPFRDVGRALIAGRPLVPVLTEAGERAASASLPAVAADVRSVLCVLLVHAHTGGDPLPAVAALADDLARRAAAREEAKALTTQARLGARSILLLTPAFIVLVAMADPAGALRWLFVPSTRVAVASGVALQALGAMWIGWIVAGVAATATRASRVPYIRVLRAIAAGKVRSSVDDEVAACAENVAFAADAGLSASTALAMCAPYATGTFGDAVRRAQMRIGVASHVALRDEAREFVGDAVPRFVQAVEMSIVRGAPLADALRSLAADIRRRSSLHLAEDIRRASVRVLLPLGVLILPAFVLACLVPLFVGGFEGIAG